MAILLLCVTGKVHSYIENGLELVYQLARNTRQGFTAVVSVT